MYALAIVCMHRVAAAAVTGLVDTLAEAPRPLWLDKDFDPRPQLEFEEMARLHDAMLLSLGLNLHHTAEIDPAWFSSATAKVFCSSVADFRQSCALGRTVFAMEDPRLALFLPIWTAALAELGLDAR